MKPRAFILSVAAFFVSTSTLAECDRSKQPAPGAPRFVASGGEVRDTTTRLVWNRCAAGMKWAGTTCTGTPMVVTLAEARSHAKKLGGGWRVPSIEELNSIVDRSCKNPAIDPDLFPGVAEMHEGKAKFWSSSPVREFPPLFYNIDFMDGLTDANSRKMGMAVRLVRRTK